MNKKVAGEFIVMCCVMFFGSVKKVGNLLKFLYKKIVKFPCIFTEPVFSWNKNQTS